MIRTIHKIFALFVGLALLAGTPISAQKLYKQFEKEKYDKIFKVLETKTVSDITDAGDLKACGTVALWNGDFEKAAKFFEKAMATDNSVLGVDGNYNYAYCLLESNQLEKLQNLSADNEWVEHIKSAAKYRLGNGVGEPFKKQTVDVTDILTQYGLNYKDDNVYYSSGYKDSYEEYNNFEGTKLLRRYAEFSSIKKFDIDDYEQKGITGEDVEDNVASKRVRLATYAGDSSNNYITYVPLKGKPERIKVHGDYVSFPFNSRKYGCAMPWFDDESDKLYFSSDMPGGQGGWDIYSSQWQDGEWQDPVNEEAMNTPFDELFPHGSEWGIMFSSNCQKGNGGFDNYLYNTDSSKVFNLAEFNSSMDEYSLQFVMKDNVVAIGISNNSVVAYLFEKPVEDSLYLYGDAFDNISDAGDLIPYYTPIDNGLLFPQKIEIIDTVVPEDTVDVSGDNLDLDLALYYEMDRFMLTGEHLDRVDNYIEKLKATGKSGYTLALLGSADGVGNVRYNDYISYQRAETLKAYMKEKMGDVELDFQTVVMGQLDGHEIDSCALRKSKVQFIQNPVTKASPIYRYRPVKGQTLSEIAEMFYVEESELRTINNIEGDHVPSEVYVKIRTVYRVKSGDILSRLADNFNCSVNSIVKINKKRNTNIREFEILVIPINN